MSDEVTLVGIYTCLEQGFQDKQTTPSDRKEWQLTVQALADWYEEHDETERGKCLRWLARTKRAPFRYFHELPLKHHYERWQEGWFWWTTSLQGTDWGFTSGCRLPNKLWDHLGHTFDYKPAVFKEYPTVRDALEALMMAWMQKPATRGRRKPKPKTE